MSKSEPELELLASIAAGKGRVANISVRVNPDVDPKTHAKIATGKAENKFGIPISRAREVYAPRGEAAGHEGRRRRHAYRQPDHRPAAVQRRLRAAGGIRRARLRADGHAISHVDLGGGLGIPYRDDNDPPPHPDAYAAMVKRATRDARLHADLRARAADRRQCRHPGHARPLLKRGEAKNFVIVDAGMNDLIRPTLYEAHHEIRPVRQPSAQATGGWLPTWSGRSANRAISWRSDRELPEPQPGDLLAVMTAGAYGAVQAGTYNTRALVPEVLVREGEWALVRPRIEVEALIAMDRLPPWL